MQKFLALAGLVLLLGATPLQVRADSKTDERLTNARQVLQDFVDMREQGIPAWLLERAYGVIVVPGVVKGALVIGGRGGRGVFAVRNPDGSWTDPVFVTLAGVNIGFQWGVQRTDVVLVLTSRNSVEGIAGGKFTLGADASVAAGPVGRSAAATTDASFNSQVLSYSRNEGIFAGVALDGSVLSIDHRSNESAYNMSGIRPSQIMAGNVATPPDAAVQFREALTRATGSANASVAVPPGDTAPPQAEAPAAAPSQGSVSGDSATTFPMEDPAPGEPPPD